MAFLRIGLIEHPYRHAQRYRQILSALIRYGFADLIKNLGIESYLQAGLQLISSHLGEKIDAYTRAERVRMALEELGPTFIKLGQILSTRADMLPADFIHELEKLQDEVPPFGFSQVKQIIESELGSPLNQIFPTFDKTPIASASLGQVHRAKLTNGQEVAVKVQRPNIRQTIEIDMEILLHLALLMEKHFQGLGLRNPSQIVKEMTYTVEKELDYTCEAAYIERFARQFKEDPTIYVPEVYREASTSRVLTMEYIRGIKASEFYRLEEQGLDGPEIAHRIGQLIMKQVFKYGFFHADLHPGNILFLPDNVICFLDFGMMGRLDRRSREGFADLIMAIANLDETEATNCLLRLTFSEPEDDEPDYMLLERDVADFIDQHFHRPLKEVNLPKLLRQLLEMVTKHRLRFSPNLFMMLKTLSAVEGLCKNLDPEFDMVEQATPFIRRIRVERYNPRRIAEEVFASSSEFVHLLKEIPGELREIIKDTRKGKVKFEFVHRGLDPLTQTYDQTSKRLSFSVVLAALIIGSALIVLSGVPPKWHDIPVIGLAGFLMAGVMGFWLLLSILRRGGM